MINKKKSKSICVVLTSPFALNAFLLKHLNSLADKYRVTVCINMQDNCVSPMLDSNIEVVHFRIERKIHVWRDLIVFLKLTYFMTARRFDAVHSITPKGGLHGMIGGLLSRVPIRTHVFTGQVWSTHTGISRYFLKFFDRIIACCATDLWADSLSQAQFLADEAVCDASRIVVPGDGSLSGVDIRRFSSNQQRRDKVRRELLLPENDMVFLFLGRLQREKGVLLLSSAFQRLALRYKGIHILWVGPDEENLAEDVANAFPGRSHVLGLTSVPEDYIDAADVLVLPSFREGFGTVVIEAAAMGRPAIASDIYGLTDAVVDGETGILVSPNNPDVLYEAMEKMLDDTERMRLGKNAHKRVIERFTDDRLTRYWLSYYEKYFR